MGKKSDNRNNLLQHNLVKLGLTNLEAKAYILISNEPMITSNELTHRLEILTSSLHRILKSLKEKGLITTYAKKPLKIKAIEPTIALTQYVGAIKSDYELAKDSVENILLSTKSNQDTLKVEFLENKNVSMEYGISLVEESIKEIIILSVGENIPQELFLKLRRAIERGVEVKMIAQVYNSKNKDLLNNWQKNGWNIRYLEKPELDFTLVTFDNSAVLLQIRSDKNRDQRVGIVIFNPSYVKAQIAYLKMLWKLSKDI